MFQDLGLYKTSDPFTILVLGAHCDDIEIGCGGTILSIINNNPNVCINWVVFTSTEKRKIEAKNGANLLKRSSVNIASLPFFILLSIT